MRSGTGRERIESLPHMNQQHPKVFISYSHDSLMHKDRVLSLSDRLLRDGVDSELDQYVQNPANGWANWMLDQIESADFVLVVCTETYHRRFRGQEPGQHGKGATWEGAVISRELYEAKGRNKKFIPIAFCTDEAECIPTTLRGVDNYILEKPDGYEELYRRLTGQHHTPKPKRGKLKSLTTKERQTSFERGNVPSHPDVPIPVILVGCGEWARKRTVLPLLECNPTMFEVVGITGLKYEEKEYRELVPVFNKIKVKPPPFYNTFLQALRSYHETAHPVGPVAVVINTPNARHHEVAEQALTAGCHVYAERPINRKSVELLTLIDLAAKKRLILYNGVQRRLEAAYKYLFHVIEKKIHFGQLASIRCVLASGHDFHGVDDWRRIRTEAGGGVVIDGGYHLLDAATWLVEAACPGTELSKDNINVCSKRFEYKPRLEVEVTAVGTVVLPKDIMLYFDLSYSAPKRSVFELIEIRDLDGAKTRILRDQVKRSTEPGRVRHQCNDRLVGDGYVAVDAGEHFSFHDEPQRGMGANNTGPLLQFLRQVTQHDPSGGPEWKVIRRAGENECDARFVSNTQEIVTAIYQTSG